MRRHVRRTGQRGDCDYCGSQALPVMRPQELRELFVPLVHMYEPPEAGTHYDPNGKRDALDFESLGHELDDRWEVFSSDLEPEDRDRLLDDIWVRPGRWDESIYDAPPSGPWAGKDERLWHVTPEQTWRWFAEALKRGGWDEIHEDDSGELMPPQRWVDASIRHRNAVRIITPRTVLYRGRPHDDPFPAGVSVASIWPSTEMHAPPPDDARRGRANRAHEPMFYAAHKVRTAICEAGREPGTYVSVRQVAARRNLRVADLTRFLGVSQPFGVANLEAIDRHSRLLLQLNQELCRPVSDADADIDYLPTQCLADAIRAAGYDGIRFRSSKHPKGTNLVIFDPTLMRVLSRDKAAGVFVVPRHHDLASEISAALQQTTPSAHS